MAMFLNTEAAHALFKSDDLFVVATLGAIHRAMIYEPGLSLRPIAPFDVLFFYCTALECIARHFKQAPADRMPTCQSVTAINVPDFGNVALRETAFAKSGLAVAYHDVVQRRASDDRIPFDESYAVAVAALALDAPTLAGIGQSKGKLYVQSDDWDDFLRGFNAP